VTGPHALQAGAMFGFLLVMAGLRRDHRGVVLAGGALEAVCVFAWLAS
jgi:hypothetical protein